MANQVLEQFKGLYTNADRFTTPGSPDLMNVDVDINGDLRKSKGYTRVAVASAGYTSNRDIVIDPILTNKVLIYNTPATFSVGDTVIVENFVSAIYLEAAQRTLLENKAFTVTGFLSGYAILDVTPVGTDIATTTFKVDRSLTLNHATTKFASSGGIANSSISILGSTYYNRTSTDFLVAMISNGTNSYLCKTSPTAIGWSYVEATPTAFNATDKANFDFFDSYLLFVNNQSATIASKDGGVFYWDGAATSIALYGVSTTSNVPVGKYIAVHKDRIWVGNIKLIGSSSIANGTSACMVSELFPIVDNDSCWNVTVTSTIATAYDDGSDGAGVFRCDFDDTDSIKQLASAFGILTIFRERSIYFFTGSIESGNATLARRLNVPYGMINEDYAVSSGGIWFPSQYGVSKVEGTAIKTAQTQFDNVTTLTVSDVIKPTYDEINNKSNLLMHLVDRKVWIHDKQEGITYMFDTLNGNWTRVDYHKLDNILDVGTNVYGLYKWYVFKLETGSQYYSTTTNALANFTSYYFTSIEDQDLNAYLKEYQYLYSIIEGDTTALSNTITFSVYYNGDTASGFTFTVNVSNQTILTWAQLAAAYSNWAAAGVTRWSGSGKLVTESRKYRLGTARLIQFKISQSDNATFKVGRLNLAYELIDVDTLL